MTKFLLRYDINHPYERGAPICKEAKGNFSCSGKFFDFINILRKYVETINNSGKGRPGELILLKILSFLAICLALHRSGGLLYG